MDIFENCKNTKQQGDLAEILALYKLTKAGYVAHLSQVSYSQYDILIEISGKCFTCQVKSSKTKAPSGNYVFTLKVSGGNKSRNTIEPFEENKSDYLILVSSEEEVWLLPRGEVTSSSSITMNKMHDRYKI